MPQLTIGKLATESGVTVDTVRYYERCGLLPVSERSEAGYRIYQREALLRIRFIRHAQALGFTLNEIRELLSLSDDPTRSAAEVKQLVQEKIADINGRIRSLERIRNGLQVLENKCPGHGSTRTCPILAALALNEDEDDDLQQTTGEQRLSRRA